MGNRSRQAANIQNMVKIHQKETKIQLIRQSERKVNTNYVIDLGRAMHLLPVLQKAWVGSICIHNQGRCALLSPGRKRGICSL